MYIELLPIRCCLGRPWPIGSGLSCSLCLLCRWWLRTSLTLPRCVVLHLVPGLGSVKPFLRDLVTHTLEEQVRVYSAIGTARVQPRGWPRIAPWPFASRIVDMAPMS